MHKLNLKQLLNISAKTSILRNVVTPCSSHPHYRKSWCRNINTKVITSNSTNRIKDVQNEDQDYIVRLQSDPDTFGEAYKKEEIYEDDLKEEEYLSNPPNPSKRLSTKQYADIIKDLIRHRKIKEAIDVVEVRMLKDDKVKPENYLYNLLLGACGRVGYTKKAFQLYNDMKRRALKVTPGTYTALFNACANSPWPEDGLTRAKHLHQIMIEKRYEPNDTNYNSMIKAYGRCGDLKTAFSLVDEMIVKGFMIKDDTLNFLLQACISDKEAGFRHALLVWRKFVDKNIAPSLFSYNLMLRCIRDCNLGDLEVTQEVIEQILSKPDIFLQLNSGLAGKNYN